MKAMKFILVFLGTALVGAVLYYSMSNPYYHMGYMMHGGGWFFGGFFVVIAIAVIVGLYVVQNQSQQSSSLEQLKQRLAKGEITVEEYNEIKQTIIGD